MATKLVLFIALLLCLCCGKASNPLLVCFYDSRSHARKDLGKFNSTDLKPAMKYCTHLIYGFSTIDSDNYEIKPLNTDYDRINYERIINLKTSFPQLKILLSVGGNADDDKPEKYLTLLESSKHRMHFVKSVVAFLKKYKFDGIDLAWQFPTIAPKTEKGVFKKFFGKLIKDAGKVVGFKHKPFTADEKQREHKSQFTKLVSFFRTMLNEENLMLTITVLPNVNTTAYFNIPSTYVDFVNLLAFDYYTPERYPKQADYPAPFFEFENKQPHENGDFLVTEWLQTGIPSSKLTLGIPTFVRTWKTKKALLKDGKPPLEADGPGKAGPYTEQPGLLSYSEFCLEKMNNTKLQIFVDETILIPASYAYRVLNNDNGIWMGYDDEDSIKFKINVVKSKNLGGIALYDLSSDDFSGICGFETFPLLSSASLALKKN